MKSRSSTHVASMVAFVMLIATALFNTAVSERFDWAKMPERGLAIVLSISLLILGWAAWWQARQAPDGRGGVGVEELKDLGDRLRNRTREDIGERVANLIALGTPVPLQVLPDLRLVHDPLRPDMDLRSIDSVKEAWERSEGPALGYRRAWFGQDGRGLRTC